MLYTFFFSKFFKLEYELKPVAIKIEIKFELLNAFS